MKKKEKNSTRAFALRIALALALTSISAILLASSFTPPAVGPQPDRPTPDVVAMAGPVSQDLDLRALPYIAPNEENEERRLTRHPFPLATATSHQQSSNPHFHHACRRHREPSSLLPEASGPSALRARPKKARLRSVLVDVPAPRATLSAARLDELLERLEVALHAAAIDADGAPHGLLHPFGLVLHLHHHLGV